MQAEVNIFRKLQFFFMKLWSLGGIDSSRCDHYIIYYKPPGWSSGSKEGGVIATMRFITKMNFFF